MRVSLVGIVVDRSRTTVISLANKPHNAWVRLGSLFAEGRGLVNIRALLETGFR